MPPESLRKSPVPVTQSFFRNENFLNEQKKEGLLNQLENKPFESLKKNIQELSSKDLQEITKGPHSSLEKIIINNYFDLFYSFLETINKHKEVSEVNLFTNNHKDGGTILHTLAKDANQLGFFLALKSDDFSFREDLLLHINDHNQNGFTALDVAMQAKNTHMITQLIALGAKSSKKKSDSMNYLPFV